MGKFLEIISGWIRNHKLCEMTIWICSHFGALY